MNEPIKTSGGIAQFLRDYQRQTGNLDPEIEKFVDRVMDWREPVTFMHLTTGRMVTLTPPPGGGDLRDAMLQAMKELRP